MTETQTQSDPSPVYLMFVGQMDLNGAKRILDALAITTRQSPRVPVHLAIQSTGGFVSEGIMLYETFQSLPIDLTVYNMGGVLSIAAIAFLGARNRKASEHAAFMFHRSSRSLSQPLAVAGVRSMADSMDVDDIRTAAIMRKGVKLTEKQMVAHREGDLWLSAQDARAAGIIDEIAGFSPPLGAQVWSI